MPRPLVYGNGKLLIALDDRFNIRELFYPQVGKYNHLSGNKIRMGAWLDYRFSWCDEGSWTHQFEFDPQTAQGKSRLENTSLGLRLEVRETVHPEFPIFLRKINAYLLSKNSTDLRLFFTHDLHIQESDIGDTAFYSPQMKGVVHYKRDHFFLFGGCCEKESLAEYTTGIKGFGGLEGTWRDAEDGHLHMHPIAQGSVDSTFCLKYVFNEKMECPFDYWIVCGRNLEEISKNLEFLEKRGFQKTFADSAQFYKGWCSNGTKPEIQNDSLNNLFYKSLYIIQTQIDQEGAILAANDSDIMLTNRANYSYCWPRDGALVADVMVDAGHPKYSENFYNFCSKIITNNQPFFLQKYNSDGTVGASWHPWLFGGNADTPYQGDETALTLYSLAKYLDKYPDKEKLNFYYEKLIHPCASFLAEQRDPTTGLPRPSWDLWEERRGVHTWTTASIALALRQASKLAKNLSKKEQNQYKTAAEEVEAALHQYLFDETRGVYFRSLRPHASNPLEPDLTMDASVLCVGLWGLLEPNDPRFLSNLRAIEDKLLVRSKIGGLARYEGDYYFRQSEAYPGNPWIITTMWLAQSLILLATEKHDLEEPLEWLLWAHHHAASTGVLSEQIHPETGEPLSVSPLTWSHAEYVQSVLLYGAKLKELSPN